MRYLVLYQGETVGEAELREGDGAPGIVVGALEPTAAYTRIQSVCRQPADGIVAARGGVAAFDILDDDPLPEQALEALLASVLAVAALQLELADLTGRRVATIGPVSVQDYTGSATEHLARITDGAIMIGATLAPARDDPSEAERPSAPA